MQRQSFRLLVSAALMAASSLACAQDVPPEPDHGKVPVSQGGESRPYLTDATTPDFHLVLPPPPKSGSPAEAADKAAYVATRRLENTPRWSLAIHDADAKPDALLTDFDCALGFSLGEAKAPHLHHLLGRVLGDVEVAFRTAKADIKRPRPLVGNDLPICVPRDERLTHSYSYPSGHATRGWTFALILAELAPEHATAVLHRGRVYGESRVVCGAHFPTDVEAGRTVAAGLVAALHGDAAFRADLDAARAEIAAAASTKTDPETCRPEVDAAATVLPDAQP